MHHDKMLVALYTILVLGTIAIIVYTQGAGIQIVFIPLVIGAIGYGHVQSKFKREFTQQFGAAIGFAYAPTADMSTVAGKLFKIGYAQKIYDVLTGTESGRPTRVFSYKFTVGSGKNSHTYFQTVFETSFANMMPDITLTSRASMFSAGPSMFGLGDEHIELEGDFNKYFTLRVPKGYETEAYQILPPNVMADLIDKAKDLNFEFNDNKLYVYSNNLVMVREKLQAMFDLTEYLDGLFGRSARAVDIDEPAVPAPESAGQ
jgi:hypothetical protein